MRHIKSISFLVACLIFSSSLFGCISKREFNSITEYQKILDIYARKNYSYTIKLATRSIKEYKNNPDVFYVRGLAYRENRDFNEAIRDFSKAISLDSSNAQYYYYRALTYQSLGSYRKAMNDLTLATNIDSNYGEAYYLKGYLHYLIGETEQAIVNYNRAIHTDFHSNELYYNYALILFNSSEYAKAEKIFSTAIEGYISNMDAYYYRGIARLELRRTEDARADLYTLLYYNSTRSSDIYFYIGLSYYIDANNAEAIRNFTRAISLDPSFVQAYLNRGSAYKEIGDTENANRDFARASRLAPN